MKKLLLGIGITLVIGAGSYGLFADTQVSTTSIQENVLFEGVHAQVFKSPSCGCCSGHAEAMRDAGIELEIIETDNLVSIKNDHGIDLSLQSCHTTVMVKNDTKYVVEGHVPIEALEQLWRELPDTAGIALPGMPRGTPGMSGVKQAPYEIMYIDRPQEVFTTI